MKGQLRGKLSRSLVWKAQTAVSTAKKGPFAKKQKEVATRLLKTRYYDSRESINLLDATDTPNVGWPQLFPKVDRQGKKNIIRIHSLHAYFLFLVQYNLSLIFYCTRYQLFWFPYKILATLAFILCGCANIYKTYIIRQCGALGLAQQFIFYICVGEHWVEV